MTGTSTAPHQTQELRKSKERGREYNTEVQSKPQQPQPKERQKGKMTSKSSSSSSFVSVLLEMAFCITGIYLCFGLWSIKQERVVTKPYYAVGENRKLGEASKFSSVFVLGFAQACAAVCVGSFLLLVQSLLHRGSTSEGVKGTVATANVSAKAVSSTSTTKTKLTLSKSKEKDEKTRHGLNSHVLRLTILMGFTNAFSSALGYAAMRRLPYPVVLATKMSKMVPVMIVGFFWYGTRYSLGKCVSAAVITCGVICFYLLEEVHHPHQESNPRMTTGASACLGFLLLFINLITDGFTSSTQDVLVRSQRWGGNKLMVFANISSGLWLAIVLIALEVLHPIAAVWLQTETVSASTRLNTPFSSLITNLDFTLRWLLREVAPLQDFSQTWRFFQRHPDAMYDVAVMSCLNAVGQVFIFRTISLFGALTLVALTLLRKSGSVVLSILVHGHHVAVGQWIALLVVFAGVVWEGFMHARRTPERKTAKVN